MRHLKTMFNIPENIVTTAEPTHTPVCFADAVNDLEIIKRFEMRHNNSNKIITEL